MKKRAEPGIDGPTGPPNTQLTRKQVKVVARLSTSQVASIDRSLLAICTESWQKVAFVVGTVLMDCPAELTEVPIGYYARRVKKLVADGELEVRGNVHYVRFSEVRLPTSRKATVVA